jgi:ribose 5-phosphate isomerase RpiB
MVSQAEARAILDVWITTPFDDGRHAARVAQIDNGDEAVAPPIPNPSV